MQKEIPAAKITAAIAELCISANIDADESVRKALEAAHANETSPAAKNALSMIVENMKVAETERMPMCQDTGIVVVFIEIGQDVRIIGNLENAINEGVRQGYRDGYLRASVISCPFERLNTKDNTPAVIYYNIVEGDAVTITVMPKGFGSENKSALKMLPPSAGIDGIEDFVLKTVKKAGSAPCPPILVGIGIGGTMEKAALMAKQALAHDILSHSKDAEIAEMEKRLLCKINGLGIGAAGFGGNSTAIGVRILTYPTHIAGLPVAVNLGCHVSRHKTVAL